MSAQPITTFTTNNQKCSVKKETLDCNKLWTMGQEEAIRRLSIKKGSSGKYELVSDFSARAARIAAAYAAFYLEQGEDGKPAFKGRFYWMGLAAFASKQVKCGLDFIPNDPLLIVLPLPLQPPMRIGKNSLGKGNFWLFQDIFVWHWFYAKYPTQFEECAPERNARSCEAQVQLNIDKLPWAEEALSILKNLHATEEIKSGFKNINKVESLPAGPDRREAQLASLLDIADHEQRKILQPLIYNDPHFQVTLDTQAALEWVPLTPVRSASFGIACDISDAKLHVRMKKGDLYNEAERMKFIEAIAEQYHLLMETEKDYMETQISSITSWKNET
ncbi:DUF2515 family protein [Pseudomonas chlororaphis]|uniref:DUF2515 family protein n=1 Tax=Pseudomonas chlororaphis TaxID=587753 RepID=UPI002368D62B|nr:hypothetical protein [Pseudomonas chlororaphis]WDH32313.1 hypothetical protein PUP62_15690 [Pseudomonas chlororaphis]WDH38397.1 hypothetical protein PUP51_15695 [Pseudomonas chlororaphis]